MFKAMISSPNPD